MLPVSQKTEDATDLRLKLVRFTLSTGGRHHHFPIVRTTKPFEQFIKVFLRYPTQEAAKEVKNPTLSVAGHQEIV